MIHLRAEGPWLTGKDFRSAAFRNSIIPRDPSSGEPRPAFLSLSRRLIDAKKEGARKTGSLGKYLPGS
jgi:hypothetical protein